MTAGPGGERSTFADFAAELRALHEEREREEREEIEAEAEELQVMREEIVALEAELENADRGIRNAEVTNAEGGAEAKGVKAKAEARAVEIEKMTFDECMEHLKTLQARRKQQVMANAEGGDEAPRSKPQAPGKIQLEEEKREKPLAHHANGGEVADRGQDGQDGGRG